MTTAIPPPPPPPPPPAPIVEEHPTPTVHIEEPSGVSTSSTIDASKSVPILDRKPSNASSKASKSSKVSKSSKTTQKTKEPELPVFAPAAEALTDSDDSSDDDDDADLHAFDHPSTYVSQPWIWLPKDTLGLSGVLVEDLKQSGVDASDIGSSMDEKGVVEVKRNPPDEDWSGGHDE